MSNLSKSEVWIVQIKVKLTFTNKICEMNGKFMQQCADRRKDNLRFSIYKKASKAVILLT